MSRRASISKMSIQAINRQTEYADNQTLNESIAVLSAKHKIPLFNYIRDTVRGEIDSISLTRDKPYFYFFARRFDESLSITVKESDRMIEFSLPIDEAQKLIVS